MSRTPPPPMSPPRDAGAFDGVIPAATLRALAGELTRLHEVLKNLATLAGRKLAAVRLANSATLQACAAEEGVLLKQVFDVERGRDAVLARLAQQVHWEAPRPPTLMELAARLPEPLASSLRARSEALRTVAKELQRKNAIFAEVARNLQSHFDGIFAELAGAHDAATGYSPRGTREVTRDRKWVDAVG
jgi:hypothetical protein